MDSRKEIVTMAKQIKPQIIIDSGTSYSKVYHLSSHAYEVIPSNRIKELTADYSVAAATGHNANRLSGYVVNELIALAKGAESYIKDEDTYTVVDCGSRDIKYISVSQGVATMDWNAECGAFCGQIVELLQRHFQCNPNSIQPADRPLSLTCGILGMTRMFDLIADDCDPDYAFARFMKGLADNVHAFAKKPDVLYISGGLCDNPLFLRSFDSVQVIPLGRFVLVDGLRMMIGENDSQ